MKTAATFLLVPILAWAFPDTAHAYQISPCYRVLTYSDAAPHQQTVRHVGRLCALVMSQQQRTAVHEHMTAAAIREYRASPMAVQAAPEWKWQYMVEPTWTINARQHRSFAIIFGTWWNDDPLMLTLGQGADFSTGGYKVWSAFQPQRATYAGAQRNCGVDADIHLARASHLGKLQHLHFMTTDATTDDAARSQRVEQTVQSALTWMAFAYQVATGELRPDQALTAEKQAELSLPSIALNHCVRPENVKIRTLFARQGQPTEERNRRTPDIALGSMLHILQDSFSPAHACRVSRELNGKGQALLHDVANYALQDKDAHAALDQYPPWFLDYLQTGRHLYGNDPVTVGAWLIAAVDRQLPWPEVEAHLRATIFAPAPASASGTPEQCMGRS
ncbi:hypothetical protein O0880_11765 [Janthinobacterium sp. SUN118]|uniref:hypothetical protein n=1 Tax=Janthinobacterium sp. SUN118 TaxID=3004100 RepID=UPI0025B0D2B5|nr:hypothetical protein [Janthinobacterium sp. SUN118]MDN2710094.1 hypothetical protein [Janthinobacterium sp. SUN118]